MTDTSPKLMRILQAVSNRLTQIRMASGYYTDAGQQVVRGQYTLDHTQLPGCAVYLASRSPVGTPRGASNCDAELVIEVIATFGDEHPEDLATMLAGDVQRAIESTDRTLGGLLSASENGGITWQGEEIYYPENSDKQVGVRVTYAAPHIRHSGDPTQ